MSPSARPSALDRLSEMPLARVAAYYVLVIAGAVLLVRLFPDVGLAFSGQRMQELTGVSGRHGGLSALAQADSIAVAPAGEVAPAIAAALAMLGATIVMLPVVWIYTMTRQRKGYLQSTVQTLVILPAVVAGVVILVKNSLALAFSLAGIAAAINFRSRIRDTKDAVYIFLAIVIGLAAGVQIISVALAVSLVFNLLMIVLAWTDFGRTPAALEGARARARLQRARALAEVNRTGMFVSVIEREILKSMSPEQLDSLADRARRIRGRNTGDLDGQGEKPLDTVVRIYAAEPDAVRATVEAVLATEVKAWRFGRVVNGMEGGPALEYHVRLRKRMPGPQLVAQLRERGAPGVLRAELA
jgi:hypothetical protein